MARFGMSERMGRTTRRPRWVVRIATALGMTMLLLVFLVATRQMEDDVEIVKLRTVKGVDPVRMPAPPPPPTEILSPSKPTPPPPPPSVKLPKLDLSVNDAAPQIQAEVNQVKFDLEMKPVDSEQMVRTPAPEQKAVETAKVESPTAANLYSASHLDLQPRLIYQPDVDFPQRLIRRGVREGKVILEVLIDTEGKVKVRGIVASSHRDFIPIAKSFAERARFTPPKKDGRVVNAIFNWPLLLRP